MSNDNIQEWNEGQRHQILQAVIGLARTLEHNKVPPALGTSAAMILTAELCAQCTGTDEDFVNKFRICLMQARETRELARS